MKFEPVPEDDDFDDPPASAELAPLFPKSGWEIAAITLAWLVMVGPFLLQAVFSTGHVVASLGAVQLIFEASSWACWLAVPLVGYAAWRKPTVLHGLTLLAALIGVYLHQSIVSISGK